MRRVLGGSDPEALAEDILPEGGLKRLVSGQLTTDDGDGRLLLRVPVSTPKEAFDDPGLNFGWSSHLSFFDDLNRITPYPDLFSPFLIQDWEYHVFDWTTDAQSICSIDVRDLEILAGADGLPRHPSRNAQIASQQGYPLAPKDGNFRFSLTQTICDEKAR